MMPPPIAANIPSLRLAMRQTGPPNTEAMNTAHTTGIASIPPSSSSSSSSDFFFFFFFLICSISEASSAVLCLRREDRTLQPRREAPEALLKSATDVVEDLCEMCIKLYHLV